MMLFFAYATLSAASRHVTFLSPLFFSSPPARRLRRRFAITYAAILRHATLSLIFRHFRCCCHVVAMPCCFDACFSLMLLMFRRRC